MNQRDQAGFAAINAHASEVVDSARNERNRQEAMKRPKRHVGQSVERFEDPAILTGRGRYGDDIGIKPGTLHAAILRAPHAHAELVSLDTSTTL
jgi:2-furoyl-CoA dehydrogenase large subunit